MILAERVLQNPPRFGPPKDGGKPVFRPGQIHRSRRSWLWNGAVMLCSAMHAIDTPMKTPDLDTIKANFQSGLATAKARAEPLAKKAIEGGNSVIQSKISQRVAIGAVAGGAIARAIPFLPVRIGAIAGAGLMLFLKTISDKDY